MDEFWIGFRVSYIISAIVIFLGGIGDMLSGKAVDISTLILAALGSLPSIVAISIFCTLGISLIIWIPIFWLVGQITLLVFPGWKQQNQGGGTAETRANITRQETPKLTPTQMALVRYITEARNYGFSDTQIVTRLSDKGWSDEQIAEAQSLVQNM